MRQDGSGFKVLHSFDRLNGSGYYPSAGLVAGDILYGTTTQGGSSDKGVMFGVALDGSGFTLLRDLDKTAYPWTLMLDISGVIYGVASHVGGRDDPTYNLDGALFQVRPDGQGFTIVHSFGWLDGSALGSVWLTRVGNSIFGVTETGGFGTWYGYYGDGGVVFRLDLPQPRARRHLDPP